MIPHELFLRLGLALAIGLLIGVERGWRDREGKPGSRAAGIRTHALIGLLGGTWGLLGHALGESVLGFAVLAFAGWFGYFEWRQAEAVGSHSATGYVAGLLAFALGAYAAVGDMSAAGSAAVATTFILAQRHALHGFLERLKWVELRAALLLLVMTFVLLPVLPNRTIDPWNAINPYQLWLLTILAAGLSYGGYIAVGIAGGRKGLLFGGAAGGLVSSTTVTWTFACQAKDQPQARMELVAGTAAAWAVSLVRMTAIAVILSPTLAKPLAGPVGAALAVIIGATVQFYRYSVPEGSQPKLALEDPFDIWAILRFCSVLTGVMLAAKLAARSLGENALTALAAVSGLVDVDPITLSVAKMTGISADYAALVILVAGGANLVGKSIIAVLFGGVRFAWPLIVAAALSAVAAGLIVLGRG